MIKLTPTIQTIFRQNTNTNGIAFCGHCSNRQESDCFVSNNCKSIQTAYGVVKFFKDGQFKELVFTKPVNLGDALDCIKKLRSDYNVTHHSLLSGNYVYEQIEALFEDKFKNDKFVAFVGAGNTALALKNTDGKILKIARLNQFELRDDAEDFDAKVYDKGSIGSYFYYLQEECKQENLDDEHVREMAEMIKNAGYDVFDLSPKQIGFNSENKLCLLDPECALDNQKLEAKKKAVSKWLLEHGIDEDYI